MNERIKELKHQASLWCDINVPEQFGEYGYGEAWEDKFAELIVKECVETLGTYEDYWTHEQQMSMLKKHFGVEE